MISNKIELDNIINELNKNEEITIQLEAIKKMASLVEERKQSKVLPFKWTKNVQSGIKLLSEIIWKENLLEDVGISEKDISAVLSSYRMTGNVLNSIKSLLVNGFNINSPDDKTKFKEDYRCVYKAFVTALTKTICCDTEFDLNEIDMDDTEFVILKAIENDYFDDIYNLLVYKKDMLLNGEYEEVDKVIEIENDLQETILDSFLEKEENIRSAAGYIDMLMYAILNNDKKLDLKEFTSDLNYRLHDYGLYANVKNDKIQKGFRNHEVVLEGLNLRPEKSKNINKEMDVLQEELDSLYLMEDSINNVEYIDSIIGITTKMIRIQPFSDGNKRTARAFCNAMFLRRNLPILSIDIDNKKEYNEALDEAFDETGKVYMDQEFSKLKNIYYNNIVESAKKIGLEKELDFGEDLIIA